MRRIIIAVSVVGGLFSMVASGAAQQNRSTEGSRTAMQVEKSEFGSVGDRVIHLFRCTNANGLVLTMTNYGAIVVSMEVPDRQGRVENVNVGFDNLDGYLQRHPYFGSTVGRYGNRIAKGRFSLDGHEYKLAVNNGPNHLHGGEKGFDRAVWRAQEFQSADDVGVEFSYVSQDGEEGYPGALDVTVRYALTNQNELTIEYSATTDKATPLNLTNHCYWNLAGVDSSESILNHEIMIAADKFLAVDETLIPTGQMSSVQGTPMDFTTPQRIGARIQEVTGEKVGYDHCYVLRSQDGTLALAARVKDPDSGRVLEIHTTQPGIQFYTGNFLAGAASDDGRPQHSAFCLETQHYPDSPNQDRFPSTILRPGQTYKQKTVHRFTVE